MLQDGIPWHPREDRVLLDAVLTFGKRWILVTEKLNEDGNRWRSLASVRNRFQRISHGVQCMKGKKIRNRCTKCGAYRRGHTCNGGEDIAPFMDRLGNFKDLVVDENEAPDDVETRGTQDTDIANEELLLEPPSVGSRVDADALLVAEDKGGAGAVTAKQIETFLYELSSYDMDADFTHNLSSLYTMLNM